MRTRNKRINFAGENCKQNGNQLQRDIPARPLHHWQCGQKAPLPAANCQKVHTGHRLDERRGQRDWPCQVQLSALREAIRRQAGTFIRKGE